MDNKELQDMLDREAGVEVKLVKLDLGGGDNVKEGFDCVDAYAPNAKYKVDLLDFSKPWPFADNSVDEIHCSHFLEHIPGQQVDYKLNALLDLLISNLPIAFSNIGEELNAIKNLPSVPRRAFMDEVWRIMKPGAKAVFITPYWSSIRAYQDYNHQWPPIGENSYVYFNKAWRQANKLEHYLKCKCDFDIIQTAAILDQETAGKSAEVGAFWNKHYINSVQDLIMTLQKRPPEVTENK